AGGLVILLKETEEVTITAKAGGVVSTPPHKIKIKPVPVPVTGIILTEDYLSIEEGDSAVTLGATVYPANATNQALIWVPGNDSVASISGSGTIRTVTPNGVGETAITVKTDTGIMVSCRVTVSESKNLAIKFKAQGTGSALVADTFTRIHEYLNGISSPFIDKKIKLGDYIDLAGLKVEAYNGSGVIDESGNTPINNGANGYLLRIMVVGINSFNPQANGRTSYVGGVTPAIPHIVMQFQNAPVIRILDDLLLNRAYVDSDMRAYITVNFRAGLQNAGVPIDDSRDIIWGPTREITNTALNAETVTDKLWLPTAWEMFHEQKQSNDTHERENNQACLEYYTDDPKRVKYKVVSGVSSAAVYWTSSPVRNNSTKCCVVTLSGGANVVDTSFSNSGVAPAFCVK
ncbi:MAG: DUF6273 domain-containing protein, partial [Spirochaetaceae bacterium]|nr:DUF6273 domain-containing protein [Spirochaetaceae bacterium]